MTQNQTLKYSPSQQDYANVLRIFFWKRLSTRISLIILALAFGMIVYVIISKGSPPTIFELIWLLLPPLFVIFVFYFQPSRTANQAWQNEKLTADVTWEVSDAEVRISTRFGSSDLSWESLDKLVTSRDYYLLLFKGNKNAFRFLPRRVFNNAQEQEQFLELVAKHLPIK